MSNNEENKPNSEQPVAQDTQPDTDSTEKRPSLIYTVEKQHDIDLERRCKDIKPPKN